MSIRATYNTSDGRYCVECDGAQGVYRLRAGTVHDVFTRVSMQGWPRDVEARVLGYLERVCGPGSRWGWVEVEG